MKLKDITIYNSQNVFVHSLANNLFFKEHFRSQYTFSSDMYTNKQSQDKRGTLTPQSERENRKRTRAWIKGEKIKYIKVVEKSTK